MAKIYTIGGKIYDAVAPEETIRGTVTIKGKFIVTSNGKTITLSNPSKSTLKYYVQNFDVKHAGTSHGVVYGSDELFHFVEIPEQFPYNPPVTPDIPTNDGNVCEYWDASCHVQQGLDWVWGGAVEGIESSKDIIDKEVKIHTDNYNIFISDAQKEFETRLNDVRNAGQKTAKDLQDSLDNAWATGERNLKDLQDSFDDAAEKAAKDLQDALDAAGKGVSKPITDMMMIGGVAVIGLLLVMKK